MVNIRADKYNRFLQTKKMMDQQNQDQYPPGVQPDEYNRFLHINKMMDQQNHNQYTTPDQPNYNNQGNSYLGILITIVIVSFWLPRLRIYVAEQWKPYLWIFLAIVIVYTITYNFVRYRFPSPFVFLFSLINLGASFAIMDIIMSNYMDGYPLSTLSHNISPLLELIALAIETLVVFAAIPFLQRIVWKVFRM